MRRLLAVAVAVVMVAGALYLRQQLDDDGDGDGADGGRAGRGDGVAVLVCATELAVACQAVAGDGIEVRVEPAGTTADALVQGEAELDGWFTLAPWPAIVDEARARAAQPAVFETASPPALARTPLVLVGVSERLEVLVDRCEDGEVYWACIGAVAGQRWADLGGQTGWGDVRPAHDAADVSATGLAVLGSAVADYFGRTDVSSADFEDDGFRRWFNRLERASTFRPRFDSLVEDLLLTPGSFDAVGALESVAQPLLDRGGTRSQRLQTLYPSAMATADAVLALRTGQDGGSLSDAVGGEGVEALKGARWHVDDPGLPETNGLPPAGVLDALRELWREAAR